MVARKTTTKARRSARIAKYFKKFNPYRLKAIADFKRKHGRKPRNFDEYSKCNVKAGIAYRRDYK